MGIFKSSTVSTSSPRLSSFMITQSTYGSPIKIVFGTTMIAGVLIDYDDFTAIAHTETTHSGGKGGGVSSSKTTYTYTVALAIAIAEGTLTGIGKVWDGSKTTDLGALGLTFFNGAIAQSPWGYMLAKHPNKALTYSGTGYVAGVLDLGDSSSLPNFNFEVYGLCQSQTGTATTSKVLMFAYQDTIEISNFSSNSYVEEYQYGSGWIRLDSKYYSIDQKKDSHDNGLDNVYVYTFNFDQQEDGSDRDAPLYIRIHYTATAASVSYAATDANPRDILYTLLTNTTFGECFPVDLVDDWSSFAAYCRNNSILLSVAIESSEQVSDIISRFMEVTNSEYFFSQGKAKIVPYWDNLTPLYDIQDDNIIDQGENSLTITRTDQSDVYNIVPLEFYDRNNDYNPDVVYATDEGDIELHGVRQKDALSHHEITNRSLAQTVADTIKQKQLYIRNRYTVKLSQAFILLEPMDPVTLACDLAGLSSIAVRVVDIQESSEDYSLEITFEDNPSGVVSAPTYETQDVNRGSLNLLADPGPVNIAAILEPPAEIAESGTGMEVWIYAAGISNYWGGCGVWVSDDNEHFQRIGYINGRGRIGTLLTYMSAASDPDTGNIPTVDLSRSLGTLASGTQQDADYYNTLCYVDGEFMSYATANLVGPYQYKLAYFRRGVYNKIITEHNAGAMFVRLDGNKIVKTYTTEDIGRVIYLKFTSINIFGAAEQDLSDAAEYSYAITGSVLSAIPPDVEQLNCELLKNNVRRYWWTYNYPTPNDIAGFRIKYIQGTVLDWNTATNITDGLVTSNPYETHLVRQGVHTVMIKAVDTSGNESANFAFCTLDLGDLLEENVLYTKDFSANNWSDVTTQAVLDTEGYLKPPDTTYMWPEKKSYMWGVKTDNMWNDSWGTYTVDAIMQALASGQCWYRYELSGPAILYYKTVSSTYLKQKFWKNWSEDSFWGTASGSFWSGSSTTSTADLIDQIYKQYSGKFMITAGEYLITHVVALNNIYERTLVKALENIIDVPDRQEHFEDVTVPVAGLTLPIVTPNYYTTAVHIDAIQGTNTDISLLPVIVTRNPCVIKVKDNSGNYTTASIDVTWQGFEKEVLS